MRGFALEQQKRLAASLVRVLALYRPLTDAYVIPPLPPRFRRHLRPKKQHEVRRLAQVLERLSQLTGCPQVVDVGAGQGHLARFLAFGLRLSVTAVEGDARLVTQAARFDRALALELEKEQARRQAPDAPPVQGPSHVVGWVTPDTRWPEFVELLRSGKVAGGGSPWAATTCQPREPCEPGERGAGKGGADCGGGDRPESLEQNPPTHLQGQLPQGPLLLTGLHACGDLSATLLRLFVACPHMVGITSVSCCYMKLSTGKGDRPGYPLSDWVAALPGHQLSYKAREGACHAMEDYLLRLEHDSPSLKTHCYRARLETLIRAIDPTKKRLGVQAIPKAHQMTFEQYARQGLERVGMSPRGPLEPASPAQQRQVVVFFSLAHLLAPLVETLILLDRMIYLQEQGFPCALVPLFDPALSARNLVLVAAKKVPPSDLWGLAAGE
ncbi:PREDICTED: protein RRNAD1 [Thamnophis sirtalis]|uniref:Protein RRNAD1 n=1 Tax=Thamnophis sirtalis TaxID=35019 RepID=A0A6I9XAQ1_9SAUR|nr:PREDICTED: protein RRNAD1 [Thamnophis sirtalis]